MKTGKNTATNNYIVALWSSKHYEDKGNPKRNTKRDNIFIGQIRNVKTKETKFFNNITQMLGTLDQMYREDEKRRKEE